MRVATTPKRGLLMSKDHEITFLTPLVGKFGTFNTSAIKALIFQEDGLYSVDAATEKLVLLFLYAGMSLPQKNFIKALAVLHRDAVVAALN